MVDSHLQLEQLLEYIPCAKHGVEMNHNTSIMKSRLNIWVENV